MDSFEEEVNYFIYLVSNNIQKAKTLKKGIFEMVFYNLNIRLDGQEIAIYNEEKDVFYNLFTKDIQKFSFEHYLAKHLALNYIDLLTKYNNNKITFEEVANIPKETKPTVKSILQQADNVMDQLKLLCKNNDILEVQEYVSHIYNDKFASDYIKYLIDRYYYNKKGLIQPKKNGLENMGKIKLE